MTPAAAQRTGYDSARRLVAMLRDWPWALPLLALLGIAASLSEGLGIGLLIPFLHLATGHAFPDSELARQVIDIVPDKHRLLVFGLAIVAMVAARTVLLYANVVFSSWLNGKVSRDLRRRMFRQVLDLGHVYVSGRPSGDLLNVLDSQVWRFGDALTALFTYVVSVSTVMIFGILLLLLSWQLAAGIAIAVLCTALMTRLLNARVNRLSEQGLTANAAVLDHIAELLNGARTIIAFGQEKREAARFDAATERLRLAFLGLEKANGVAPALIEFLYTPLLIGAIIVAIHAGVALPILFAFLLLVYRLQPHVRNLEYSRVQLAGAGPVLASIDHLLTRVPHRPLQPGQPFHGLRDAIRFDGVSFRYDGRPGPPVLNDVHFEVKRGSVTAIVGPSGAGKSTLFNLILRLVEPRSGSILVDGVPLSHIDIDDWRAHIALAGQDVELFSGTVAENIAYGAPDADASDAAIWSAARRAGADAFIRDLPQGMNTPIGTRGATLSGGQRQRIGLARAMIRRPQILLLDEATNALDGESEAIVQKAMAELAGEVTIIIIAHRLSTCAQANCVLSLANGRVKAVRSVEELPRSTAHGAQA